LCVKLTKSLSIASYVTSLSIGLGLSLAISVWLLAVPSSTHAQEYCPSGAVVTQQSQCPGAVPGPYSPFVRSILAHNNSGTSTNSTNGTALKLKSENKNNTNEQTVQPTIGHSNMTTGNLTVSSRPLSSAPQVQTPNTIPSSLLDGIFQKCFTSSLNPSIRSALSSADVAAIKKDAIQNMTAAFPLIANKFASDQRINETNAKAIQPIALDIADCMEQKLELKQTQQNQRQPPYQQPPSNMKQYTDPEGSFTISYPTTWSVTPGASKQVFFRDGLSTITVVVPGRPITLSSEILVRIWKDTMVKDTLRGRIYTTIQDVECSKYKVDGNTACSAIVTTTPRMSPPASNTDIDVVTSINGKIYNFEMYSPAETFNSILPIFETMLNSFKAGSSSGYASTSPSISPQQPPSPSYPYQQPPSSTNYPPPRILSHSTYFDSIGTLHLVGEVVNQSPVTAKFVKVIATFYNAYNQVIGTDFAYTQPSEVAPYQRAPFHILISSGGIPLNQVRTYTLNVSTS
jgi:PsbP